MQSQRVHFNRDLPYFLRGREQSHFPMGNHYGTAVRMNIDVLETCCSTLAPIEHQCEMSTMRFRHKAIKFSLREPITAWIFNRKTFFFFFVSMSVLSKDRGVSFGGEKFAVFNARMLNTTEIDTTENRGRNILVEYAGRKTHCA